VEGAIQLGGATRLVPLVWINLTADCRMALVRGPTGHRSARRRPAALQEGRGRDTLSGQDVRGGVRPVHPMIRPIGVIGVEGEVDGVGSCPSNRDGLPIGGLSHC
jgi:hypothetical protein